MQYGEAAILKVEKWPYFWNGSTDVREIWDSKPDVKISNF